ncbi:hypothetical protein MNBD_GAMMA03-4 [hydrothermal vent metagenome]|uniref:Calcineurin-like phosphoesterase domain-containing protein n=1 Tax=hydrothermal vent metagenome TaxID=652676 RepID=A0A3B0WY09_9ZZZZ
MRRRDFLKTSIILASSSKFLASCKQNDLSYNGKDFISGFVFSDAHIGWKGTSQPTIQVQSEAIQVIKHQFPDLDLVFDTGDIHHGYLNENERNIARDQWLSLMSNPFSQSIFHYVPGNHELGKGPNDEELTASKIGSNNLRPYYSFDYKGIHFISLPQLLDTILINRESLDWLSHDLSLNRNKTTLIFSHNSIKNTTYDNGENGYRTVVNSEPLLKTINKYNNVIAWLHGHNHQYEIVKKHGRLYVSNGRIGGFNPPEKWGDFGQGHIGGVYFSINKNGLIIKCYSATNKDFLENLGYVNLSGQLNIETSFNPLSKFNYYFGHGALTNNVRHNMHNHYLSTQNVEIDIKENKDLTLNDNSNFELTTELFFIGKRIKRIIGYQLLPSTLTRMSVDEGLFINNNTKDSIILNLPSQKRTKFDFMVRGSYFRCESGDKFRTEIAYINKSDKIISTAMVKYTYFVYNKKQEIIHQSKVINIQENKNHFISESIDIPNLEKGKGSQEKYLRLSFEFINFPEKFIFSKLALSKTVEQIQNPEIEINKIKHTLESSKQFSLNMNSFQTNGLSSIVYKGTTPSSCNIKISDVLWQIRNAVSHYDNNTISLLKYRHHYQKLNEVILVTTSNLSHYLNKVVDIMPLTVSYEKNIISISLTKINNNSLLVFHVTKPPKRIIGSENNKINGTTLTIFPETKNIQLYF